MNTSQSLTEQLEQSAMPKAARGVIEVAERYVPQLTKILGTEQDAHRFLAELRSYLYRNPALYECEPATVAAGALWGAQLGLSLGPLGLFYLVPFKRNAVPIVGYRGYCELAYRSGHVKEIRAALVYTGEPFAEYGGSSPRLVHEIREHDDETPIVAAYAYAALKTGGKVWTVIREREWERARKASQLGKDGKGLWSEHRPEAIRKTAIRRLASSGSLPLTPVLGTALAGDEEPAELPPVVEGGE